MGAVRTYLYEYDGVKVRTLYANEVGRVGVEIHSRRRGCRLEETWPRSQYDGDGDDLGVGYDVGVNSVRRSLHWNGLKFVPDEPGETGIVFRKGHR